MNFRLTNNFQAVNSFSVKKKGKFLHKKHFNYTHVLLI